MRAEAGIPLRARNALHRPGRMSAIESSALRQLVDAEAYASPRPDKRRNSACLSSRSGSGNHSHICGNTTDQRPCSAFDHREADPSRNC